MTGTIAQQIALISYGNEYLSSGTIYPNFYSKNSTFQYCNSVRFLEFKRPLLGSKPKENVLTKSSEEWFKLLKQSGCKNLRLYYKHSDRNSQAPDHQLAGFVGGGGTWMIEAVHNDKSYFWANRWEVTKENDPNKKIWSVDYAIVASSKNAQDTHYNLEDIRTELESNISKVALFASNNNLSFWADFFSKSLKKLGSEKPNEDFYHTDLIINDNYGLAVQQLLFAAGSAWAFGGMGSWNDAWFENKETYKEYENLTAKLYDIVCQAIVAATNSQKQFKSRG